MDSSESAWVDPATARSLMLEYQQNLGLRGASEIEQNILKYCSELISRKTLENWLNGREKQPKPRTLAVVNKLLRTAHFQQIVPRAREYLDADARLLRRGRALFDLYGTKKLNASDCVRLNSLIQGWWAGPTWLQPGPEFAHDNHLYIETVPRQAFAKIHLACKTPHTMEGSGIVFPADDPDEMDQYSICFWSRPILDESALTIRSAMKSPRQGGFMLLYQLQDEPHRDFYQTYFPVDEQLVPTDVRSMFHHWNDEVFPPSSSVNED